MCKLSIQKQNQKYSITKTNDVFFVTASEKPDNTSSFAQILVKNEEKIK